ncbi:helix-turn-helix domain-containing protein [Sanguibacter antarcticus]|nr:helix-turn-helix domain-containing protein [Sanguibacter antarcticus]
MYDEKTYTVQQIADTFGVSGGTIYRHLIHDAHPA